MAVGNVPTLMDVNWQQVGEIQKAKNLETFRSNFLMSLKNNANEIAPKIYVDDNGVLQFQKGAGGKMNKTELWNSYVQSAQSMGIKPDSVQFDTEIVPYYTQLVNQNFNEQMGTLALQGIPVENVHELYRTNEEFKKSLISALQNSQNPEEVGILKNYIAPDEGKGLLETITNANPLLMAAAGYGGYYGYKMARDKIASADDDSMFKKAKGKGRVLGPIGAIMAAEMIPGMIGMDPKSQEQISNLAPYGIGGYYGLKALQDFTGASGIKDIINTKSKSELVRRAKDVGMSTRDFKDGNKFQSLKEMKKTVKAKAPRVRGGNWKSQAAMALASIVLPNLFGGGDEPETLTPGKYVSPF